MSRVLPRPPLSMAVLLALLCCDTVASAEPEPAPSTDPEPYVTRATQHFKNHAYTAAAEALSRAYELDPRPLFLFNIGQAYRLADRPREAVAAYGQFLAVAPKHALSPEAKGYVETLRGLIVERERAAATEQALEAERQMVQAAREAARQAEAKLNEARQRAPIYKRPWFWGLIGSVAASVVVAGAVGGYYANQPPMTDGGFRTFEF
jgi:tetratricopeptide (TPR) repeat protein